MAAPAKEFTAETSSPQAFNLKHYEHLFLAFQLIYQFNHPGTSALFKKGDKELAPTFSVRSDELKELTGKNEAKASIHEILDVLHEEVPTFRLPQGYHQPTVGHIKELLKFFDNENQLGFLAGKINRERTILQSFTPKQLEDLKEKRISEQEKDKEQEGHKEPAKEQEEGVPEPDEEEEESDKEDSEEKKDEGEEKTPEAKIIENPQTGPSRTQRLRDLGARVPVGRASRRLFSPILRRIKPFLEKYKEILIPAITGAALGAATGGAPTAVLYGLFGGAMGAGVIKPIVSGGQASTEDTNDTSDAVNETPSPETALPQDNTPAPQDNNAPQRRTPPLPPSPESNALAETARFAMSFPGARIWLIIGLIGLAIVVLIVMQASGSNGGLGSGGGNTQSPPTPPSANDKNLTIVKSGPVEITNDTPFSYQITLTFTGNGNADITVTDTLPNTLNFDSASDHGTASGNVVTWKLTQISSGQPKKIFLSVHPTDKDFYAVNTAQATVDKVSGGNALGGVGQASDFNNLIRTQGRNVNILGSSANEFANRVTENTKGTSIARLGGQQDRLKQIYASAAAANINPLAVLSIWGVEQSFQVNDSEFGCKPFGSGFSSQLNCSVNTLNYWMNFFDTNSTNGQYRLTPTCNYTDSFAFAYEKYTPVCVINDNNSASRANFVSFYNMILGR